MPQSLSAPAYPTGLAQRRLVPLALLVGLVLSLSVATQVAAATTWTVCASGCDYTSIKAAIAAPTTVDGDTLAIAAGTYTEPGIVVDKSLTLQGEAAATTIVQAAASPGQAPDRVFLIPSGVRVTLQALTIRYGHAFGGGIYSVGTLALIDSTVRGNSGSGVVNTLGGTLTLTHSTVSGNRASFSLRYGGGLYNTGTLTLTHSTVSGNSNASFGGGLYNYLDGTLSLINSTISGNAADAGGGISNAGSTISLINSTISGKAASCCGGGLINYRPLTVINSTISGNAAPSLRGGGLLTNSGPDMVKLINSTIANNSGGGLFNNDSKVWLTNSIIANNPHGGDCDNYNGGSITSTGYNLDSDGTCPLTAATDRPSVDPRLGPLENYGGPTFTHALLSDSPALDAIPWGTNGCGTTLYSDQRWQARPQPAGGACDIGASEVEVVGQPLSAWVAGLTPHTAVCENVSTGQAVTLTDPASPWDCEAAGLVATSGDQVALRVRGPVTQGAKDVGGAVVGMAPNGGGCTNRTTGQQVKFQALFQGMPGATAASCVAAGLVVQPGDSVQLHVAGAAE